MNQNTLRLAVQRVMPMVRRSGLLVSLATFEVLRGATTEDPAGTLDDSGFPEYVYDPVDGLVDIPCMFSTTATGGNSVGASESKGLEESKLNAPKILVLDRRYPTAETGWRAGWRVTVDGTQYDVMGVEPDSQGQYTHALCRSLTQ